MAEHSATVSQAAWRGCKKHGGKLLALMLGQALLRALALLPLFFSDRLESVPAWAPFAASALMYLLLVLPLRFFAGERLRYYSAPRLNSPRGGKPWANWMAAGLVRCARGMAWGLPFLFCVGYFIYGMKYLPFNKMWQPVQNLAQLVGQEPSLITGMIIAGIATVIFAVIFAWGWRRDLPMEYLPVRHLGPGKACRVSAQARKKGKRLLLRTTAVNFLLSLPALVGCAAVLAPYIGEHVFFSGNPQIVLGSLKQLMKTPLPMEQWVELLLVFLLLYLPFLILRKMRNAVAVRRLTRELNDAGGGHAAG